MYGFFNSFIHFNLCRTSSPFVFGGWMGYTPYKYVGNSLLALYNPVKLNPSRFNTCYPSVWGGVPTRAAQNPFPGRGMQPLPVIPELKVENIFAKKSVQRKAVQNPTVMRTTSSPTATQFVTERLPEPKISASANWQALGYNSEKGNRLARFALQKQYGVFGGDCKAKVRQSSEAAGLGTITGNCGVEALPSLRANPNYKEVSASQITDLNSLPNGTIGIFKPGSQGYNSKFGHTEIYATLNGKVKGISSGIINNIKKADYYFIPV